MTVVSNHDKNAWDASRLEALAMAIVLSFTSDYRDFASDDAVSLHANSTLPLPVWGFRRFVG